MIARGRSHTRLGFEETDGFVRVAYVNLDGLSGAVERWWIAGGLRADRKACLARLETVARSDAQG